MSDGPEIQGPIHRDPEIMGGAPVFRGTRVPVRTLFSYLEHGSLDAYLEEFTTVTRVQALAALALAEERLVESIA